MAVKGYFKFTLLCSVRLLDNSLKYIIGCNDRRDILQYWGTAGNRLAAFCVLAAQSPDDTNRPVAKAGMMLDVVKADLETMDKTERAFYTVALYRKPQWLHAVLIGILLPQGESLPIS